MPDANDPALTEICRAALDHLTSGFSGQQSRILVALSGGPDSVALLHMLGELYPRRVAAATIDHQLRPESSNEAALCAVRCQALGIAHQIMTPAVPISGSIQAEARKARYALLERARQDLGCDWIATAHHADDQLETMVMRLARGSGIDGLSGVRGRSGMIIRPLLAVRKASLISYCRSHSLDFVYDPSNDNPGFDRVRVRQALAHCDIVDPAAAARSAGALGEASEALKWVAQREAEAIIEHHRETVRVTRTDYPAELLRRITVLALQRLDPQLQPRGAALDSLISALQAGEQAMIGDLLCQGGVEWHFRPAPPRRTPR